MKPLNLRRVVVGVFILGLFLALTYWIKRASPNKDDGKLLEVRQTFLTLPLPPDFTETDSSFQSKAELALVTKYFKSPAPVDEVKEFYDQRLTAAGWTLVKDRPVTDWFRDLGGRQLTFRKQQNSVIVEYAGKAANDQWNYAISVKWEKG